LKAIVKNELKILMQDGRFWIAGFLLTTLLAVSIFVGLEGQKQKAATGERITRQLRAEWESQSEKDPHAAGHFGTYVVSPSGPGNWLDPGIEPYVGSVVFLEAHVRNEFQHRPAAESTTLRHFGTFSPAFILQIVAPLIIILFCFSSFAADRESGTLRLVLASGVNTVHLVAGKVIGNLLGLALLLAPGLVAAYANLETRIGVFDPVRLSLLALGYFLYFAVFAGLTLWVSSLLSKSQTALTTMILFWITTCFVLPRTISDFAAAQHPLPSKAAFSDRISRETQKGIDGHDMQDERRGPLFEKTLKEYGVQSVEELPVNFDAIAMQESEEYTSELYTREFNRIADILDRQARQTRNAAAVIPFFAIQNWSMALSGTDFAHHRRFSDSVEEYRRDLIEMLNRDMIENSRTGEYSYAVGREFWENVHPFRYKEPVIEWSMQSVKSQGFSLVAWALASFGCCLFAASRLKP
jgi:ABC-2 type transport system permease protein